jgi:hypothetical protein
MKLNTLIVNTALLVGIGIVTGDAEEPQTMLLYKDGEVIRVPAPPEQDLSEEDPTEAYKLADPEGYQMAQDGMKAYRESQGMPPGQWYFPPKKRDPNKPKLFEIPPDEAIPGCHYAAGASFPHLCYGEKIDVPPSKRIVFTAGKDSQSVLDEIKKKYGITGEYNVVPENYTAD